MTQPVDILFSARNRAEFTQLALHNLRWNTNWKLVREVFLYDDMSEDGATAMLAKFECPVPCTIERGAFGGPVAIMNHYLQRGRGGVFAKIDNDTIVPPRWLDASLEAMQRNPQVAFLGIEPALSRKACAPWFEGEVPMPELWPEAQKRGVALCDAIGGIGLMKSEAFEPRVRMKPFATYGGFTNWQQEHPELVKAWLAPPINVYLLDRVPNPALRVLSAGYEARGWQRPWRLYDPADSALWMWSHT